MIQAIIFDFDGIIVDSEPLHYRAFLRALEPFSISFTYETYTRDYIGYDDRDGFRAIFASHQLPLDDQQLHALIADKARAFQHIVAEGITPYPGVRELIETASQQMPIAICSGALRSDIDAVLPAVLDDNYAHRFRAIVTADDVARSKPHPESYQLACERIGVPPHHALAIEDTPAGLASARAAGLHALAVTNSCPPDQLTHAHRIVDSLADLDLATLRRDFNDGPSVNS